MLSNDANTYYDGVILSKTKDLAVDSATDIARFFTFVQNDKLFF